MFEVDLRNTTGWKPAGTESFRLASAKLLGRWGDNLQNNSDRISRVYIPDPGYIFVNVDQEGAEALVVSYLTRHGKFRDLFLNNIKSHVYVAFRFFPEEWDEVMNWQSGTSRKLGDTLSIAELAQNPQFRAVVPVIKKHPRNYDLAKRVCHAANYGMFENTFVTTVLKVSEGRIVLTAKEAKVLLDSYHALFPEIREWHRAVEKSMKGISKIQYNLQGFPGDMNILFPHEGNIRDLIAWVPQSTVGTITNIAYANFQEQIEREKLPCDLLNNKHDSYLAQCDTQIADSVVGWMKFHMEQKLTSPHGEIFRMKAAAQVGMNWGHYDPEENPEGLKDYARI